MTLSQSRLAHYNKINVSPMLYNGIAKTTLLMENKLDTLIAQESAPVHNKILLETDQAVLVYADTLPVPQRDPARGGWKHTKIATGSNKFNYYFYGNQIANPMLLSELLGTFMVGTIHTFLDTTSVPFIVLYTLPTGSGDAAAWYKSRIAYSINLAGKKLYSGEKIVLYTGEKPIYHTKLRAFKLDVVTTTGTADLTETVNLISVHSDSGTPIDHSITVQNVGWSNEEIKYNMELK